MLKNASFNLKIIMNPYIAGIFALCAATIGATLTYVLTRKNAVKVAIRHEFVKAAAEFKLAFIEDLDFLDAPVDDKVIDITKTIYDRISKRITGQEQAAIRFKAYLPENHYAGFTRAWKQYKYAGYDEQEAKTKSGFGNHKDSEFCWIQVSKIESERRKIARYYIDEVLHFTNPEKVFK